MASINQLKKLRAETDVSLAECKKALEESGGDIQAAKDVLRKRGIALAQRKSEREAREGMVESYVHSDRKIGVLVDLRCETDFVARSEEFKKLAHDLALHVAAANPRFVRPEDIPQEYLEGEIEIYREQLSGSGKPKDLIEKILEGKIEKYKKEICLLSQSFVKDDQKTVQDLISEYIAKLGENIIVERFVRYEI